MKATSASLAVVTALATTVSTVSTAMWGSGVGALGFDVFCDRRSGFVFRSISHVLGEIRI